MSSSIKCLAVCVRARACVRACVPSSPSSDEAQVHAKVVNYEETTSRHSEHTHPYAHKRESHWFGRGRYSIDTHARTRAHTHTIPMNLVAAIPETTAPPTPNTETHEMHFTHRAFRSRKELYAKDIRNGFRVRVLGSAVRGPRSRV